MGRALSQADGSGLVRVLAVYTNLSFNLSVPQFLIRSSVSSSEGPCDSSMLYTSYVSNCEPLL